MTKAQKQKIEKLVGEAYDIGHAHGGNAFRLLRNGEAIRENEGWEKVAKKIIAMLEKPQNGITSTRLMIKANNLTRALKRLVDEVESLTVDLIAFDTGKDARKIKPKRKAK